MFAFLWEFVVDRKWPRPAFWQTECAYTFGEPVVRSHGGRARGLVENPVLCRPE